MKRETHVTILFRPCAQKAPSFAIRSRRARVETFEIAFPARGSAAAPEGNTIAMFPVVASLVATATM
ncbi:alkanesulfonate monooxygenase [Mycobacterium intracellulare subsp. chimaera]|nr:alkanesulfonate monooxygenase [Mycobacterium intracellulare subsp. chimaera]ETZ27226.1 hypothetical protein L842_4814 [Mycobacterium intracellulare MIN_052511_1280]ETZ32117.1 hypothetical protein L843_4827 [Mycobacterium intracellulare MIN_061107_1834]QGK50813.1 alkanesulfonate monooxygenase [Mycobacterium intracellulare subsp. chimaera]